MNKQEFMSRLEKLLLYVPVQEREEALQYYNDYFEDAGEENEQEVIASLGSPEKVAENIKRDINQSNYGGEPDKVEPGKEIVKYQPEIEGIKQPSEKSKRYVIPTWLMIVIGICALPIICGLFGGAIGTVLGVLGAVCGIWLGLLISFGIIGLICPFAGIAIIICGAFGCVSNALAGIGIIGVGLVVLAIGLFSMMLDTLIIGKLTPAIIRLLKKGVSLLAKLFRMRGERA